MPQIIINIKFLILYFNNFVYCNDKKEVNLNINLSIIFN